jgi:anti-anti-sigma factor
MQSVLIQLQGLNTGVNTGLNIMEPPQTLIVSPSGKISAATAAEFQNQLTAAILAADSAAIALDMSQVDFLDSAGLMALVSSLSLAQRQNQRFSLCSVSASMRIIFELTQLDRVFEIFETVAAFEAALA